MQSIRILALFLILLVSLTSSAQEKDDYLKVKNGSEAPQFTVKTIDGSMLSLNQLKGQTVLLTFFATWCLPCMEELPQLEKLHQEHKNSGLVVLCIGREHQLPELQMFNQSKSFTFNIAADPDRKIYQLYAEKFIPRTFLIDKHGKIIYQSSGYNVQEFNKLRALVAKELKQ